MPVFSKNGAGQIGYSKFKIKLLDSYFIPDIKINSKCIKNLNISAKPIQTLGRKHRGSLYDTGFGNGFLDMTPKAQATKGKNA